MKTKKLLCAFLLVALSVLYIGIALINTHAGKTGERVAFHKQELHVLVENGVIADAVDYVPMLIPKDGNYQLNLNFNTSDYGFYTCAVIKDKNVYAGKQKLTIPPANGNSGGEVDGVTKAFLERNPGIKI